MRVRAASQAAPGRAENEDIAFHQSGLVGVLDGVSAPEGFTTGCRHTPGWYVRRLAARLAEGADDSSSALSDVLAAAITTVRSDHGGDCDLGNPASPAATVCLARATEDSLEYLVLSDATLVVQQDGGVHTVTDARFATVIGALNASFPPAPATRDDEFVRWRHAYFTRKYQLTNQPGGYWVASTVSDAGHQAVTGSFPLHGPGGVRHAALLTDGTSCAVDLFGLMDWPELLDVLRLKGPDELIRRVAPPRTRTIAARAPVRAGRAGTTPRPSGAASRRSRDSQERSAGRVEPAHPSRALAGEAPLHWPIGGSWHG